MTESKRRCTITWWIRRVTRERTISRSTRRPAKCSRRSFSTEKSKERTHWKSRPGTERRRPGPTTETNRIPVRVPRRQTVEVDIFSNGVTGSRFFEIKIPPPVSSADLKTNVCSSNKSTRFLLPKVGHEPVKKRSR